MATAKDLEQIRNTDWVIYLENIVVSLNKKCLGLSNYKWGYFMDSKYIELNNADHSISGNFTIGYIYCKNNLPLRFRFALLWQNELRITVDTLQYGTATTFEEYSSLPETPLNLRNYNNIYKQVKWAKKPGLIANDVISLLVPAEESIKTLLQKIEQYIIKKQELEINIDKIKTALDLTNDYLLENYRESDCYIYLRHVGSIELLRNNLCRTKTGALYLSIDTLIALIQMIDKETQELGKSPIDRYHSK